MILLQKIDCRSLGWQEVYCVYDGDELMSVYFSWDIKKTHNLLADLNLFDIQDLIDQKRRKQVVV